MFGLKMNKGTLSMLKMFGIDLKTIIPQAEKMLAAEWLKWEIEAQSRLTAVAERKDDAAFEIALYKCNEGDNLSLWRKFDLSNLEQLITEINNQQKNKETDADKLTLGTGNAADNSL